MYCYMRYWMAMFYCYVVWLCSFLYSAICEILSACLWHVLYCTSIPRPSYNIIVLATCRLSRQWLQAGFRMAVLVVFSLCAPISLRLRLRSKRIGSRLKQWVNEVISHVNVAEASAFTNGRVFLMSKRRSVTPEGDSKRPTFLSDLLFF